MAISALFVRTYLVHGVRVLGEHGEVVGQQDIIVFLPSEAQGTWEQDHKVSSSIRLHPKGHSSTIVIAAGSRPDRRGLDAIISPIACRSVLLCRCSVLTRRSSS